MTTQNHNGTAVSQSGERNRATDVTADGSDMLISADKVVGTAIFDDAGERLGTIDTIMINKRSGKVVYAVMSFGGFLGIGERYHQLPWSVLTYDHETGGYNIKHSADDLRKAPNFSRDEINDFDYRSHSSEIHDDYGDNGARDITSDETSINMNPLGTIGLHSTGIEVADDIGSTTGAGSSGMLSTGMGSNRNL